MIHLVSHYSLEKKQFERKYNDLLKNMYEEFKKYWQSYPLEFHRKKEISYEDFVHFCFTQSSK